MITYQRLPNDDISPPGISSCGTAAYVDPEHFQANIRAAAVDFVWTSFGSFEGSLTRVDLKRLWMQRGAENLDRIARIGFSSQRVVLFFACGGDRGFFSDGLDVRPDQLIVYEPAQYAHQRSANGLTWGALSLTPADLAEIAQRIGLTIRIPPGGKRITPPLGTLQQLRRLHGLATALAQSDPDLLLRLEPSHALEQQLLALILRCMTEESEAPRQYPWRKRTKLLRRLDELLHANCGRPLYMLEVCRQLGVHERVLQLCCHDHLGMSPSRYLRLQRLHLARRELQRGNPAVTRVADVAAHCGFLEFGRFAVEYRKHFREVPSATLRRPVAELMPMQVVGRRTDISETA